MDIDQLRQFLVVVRLGNITRSAEELALSQPALSRSIQRLEEEFGQPLLERRARSVRPTDAGELLASRAEQILSILDDTRAEISDDGQSGRVRLGAIPTIAPYFLPGFLRDFAKEFPRVSLSVQEEPTEQLLHKCKQGEIDLAILALPINVRYVDRLPLFDEELLLVLPKKHPLATKKRIAVGDVEDFPFVLLGEAHCLSDSVVSFCRRGEFQPLVVERTSQLTTVQELVEVGHGISVIPAMARKRDRSKARVYRSFSGQKPTRTVAAVWNPYRFESRVMTVLRDRLKAFGKEFAKSLDAR